MGQFEDTVLPQATAKLLFKLDEMGKLLEEVRAEFVGLNERVTRLESFANRADQRGERGEQSLNWAETHLLRAVEQLTRLGDIAQELLHRSYPETRSSERLPARQPPERAARPRRQAFDATLPHRVLQKMKTKPQGAPARNHAAASVAEEYQGALASIIPLID
jgi:hypothetical protein